MESNIHVGDRVKLVDAVGPLGLPELIGREGTVIEVLDENNVFPVVVSVDNDADGLINGPVPMRPEELEVLDHAHAEAA